jgi:abequosyltransferase
MNAVAEMAKGKYIWLFSADDLLERGWDRCIAPLMEKGGDVFLIPATLCDIQMVPLRENPIFQDCIGQEPIEFNITPDDNSLADYLSRAATLEALFSYMSSVMVNASVWCGLPARIDYYGSCWAHCARLMPLLFNKSKIIYLNRYLIKKRSGNDSFMANGFVARIAIAVDGWDKIIREFFLNSTHREKLYCALRKDMPIALFIYAKIASSNTRETDRLNRMARVLYTTNNPSLSTKIKYLIYRVIPASAVLDEMIKPLLPLLKRIRHKMKSLFV